MVTIIEIYSVKPVFSKAGFRAVAEVYGSKTTVVGKIPRGQTSAGQCSRKVVNRSVDAQERVEKKAAKRAAARADRHESTAQRATQRTRTMKGGGREAAVGGSGVERLFDAACPAPPAFKRP